jgi:hypothetical protein
MCALLVVWIWQKDKQHTAERKELQASLATETAQRVKDAQRFTALALELQGKVHDAIGVVKDQIEAFQDQNHLLERIAAKLPSKRGSSDGAT